MTKTNLEDKLREIIHRRWEIDDEVGLFIEIKALLQQRMDEIEGEIANRKIESGTILKVDELNTAEYNQGLFNGYNQAISDVLNIIKSVDKK